MSQADRDTLEALKEAADAIEGDAKKKLGALAAKYVPDIVRTAVVVMNDTESRQRLNAAALLAEWATENTKQSGNGGGAVKLLVLDRADIQRLGDMQREANEQRATVVEPRR